MALSTQDVLILGGGVAGMAAANVLASCGISVHLIEKKNRLGGNAFDWACMATDTCQFCGACLSADLIDQVRSRENIQVYTESRLADLQTNGDGFRAVIEGLESRDVNVSAVLLTTGIRAFDPKQAEFLEYNHPKVITTVELNSVLKQEQLPEKLSGKKDPAIAFIQCVGSRNRELGKDYCSQVCCKTAVRHAQKINHLLPESQITVFHIDLQTIGKMFRSQAGALGAQVTFLQGVPAKIVWSAEKETATVIHENEETGAREALDFDLVVLAVGSGPCDEIQTLSHTVKGTPDEWGFFSDPETTLPEGIYAAGAATGPTDIISAGQSGVIAAYQIVKRFADGSGGQTKTLAVFGGGHDAQRVARELVQSGYAVYLIDDKKHPVDQIAGLTYFPQACLISADGVVGRYRLLIANSEEKQVLDVFGIILATGLDYIPISDSGFSAFGNKVMSLSHMLHHVSDQLQTLPETVFFWLDHDQAEWKSNARLALEMALKLKAAGKTVGIVMQKMLVHGLNGQRLYDQARKSGVRFLRVTSPESVMLEDDGSAITMNVDEATLPGVRLNVSCDLLVVPECVQPSRSSVEIAEKLREKLDTEKFLQSANVRHRPVGSPRRGIFFAGACHDETDAGDLAKEINGIKAALALLETSYHEVEHPVCINENQCARCLTCVRICPHGAVMLRNHYQPVILTEACFGCGLCVSSCPATAIEQELPSELTVSSKDDGDCVIFACERSAHLAIKDIEPAVWDAVGGAVNVIPMHCAGSIGAKSVITPLSNGAQKVIVAGCHDGNCRSITGGQYADTRVRQLCDEIRKLTSRLSYYAVAANEPAKMAKIIRDELNAGKEVHDE